MVVDVPLKAGAHVFAGGIVCRNAGYGVPGADTAGLVFAGIATKEVDNSDGQNGTLYVVAARKGAFLLKHSGLSIANEGAPVFASDDETVVASSTNGVCVGRMMKYVSASECWVDVGQSDYEVPTVLHAVATSGDYDDLDNTPVIPVLPELHAVATSGDYDDLDNTPAIPTVPEAANVALIAVPGSATAEDCAGKINDVITALVNAGLMAAAV
jgi:hypothetical protein